MIKIICVGKIKDNHIAVGIDEYLTRLTKYTKIEIIELKDEKIANNEKEVKQKEAKKILDCIKDNEFVIVLDEIGQDYTSKSFAKFIKDNNQNLTFVIGGALGLDDKVRERANKIVCLSKMTFTHQMVRLFLVEQIYRAFTILNNEKYHK